MARKMTDEILEAERGAERIISDAEKRAAEISDTAKLKAAEETARILSEAEKNAEKALDYAKAAAQVKKQERKCIIQVLSLGNRYPILLNTC